MSRALEEYRGGKIGFNECCRKCEIPKPTFKRHLMDSVKSDVNRSVCGIVNGRNTALPSEIEKEIVSHIIKLEELFFRLTIMDIRRLAFQILEAHPDSTNLFNKGQRMAGKWYYAFMRRHPNL